MLIIPLYLRDFSIRAGIDKCIINSTVISFNQSKNQKKYKGTILVDIYRIEVND